ncbi:3'-5' exonuclease [Desertivirga xinjiangensis]|uniref:3'-5' exonuclease n=1 Tax=Desertivirga xinjiangensis TaxID=539206 RepID=UPI00210A72AA
MNQYLLFIDTEGSGLPKKWNEPYSKEGNWPYAVQVSWLVYTRDGRELKREDHYIKNDDFKITKGSIKIHGITRDLLDQKGEDRAYVMQLLADDLNAYKPLVVGHFIELDYHVLAADFLRADVENPIPKLNLPAFCTMLASTPFVRNPQASFLKLGQLYDTLFNTALLNPHNAIVDAKATADCFFEMLKRGDLTEDAVAQQKPDLSIKLAGDKKSAWAFFLFLCIVIAAFWI